MATATQDPFSYLDAQAAAPPAPVSAIGQMGIDPFSALDAPVKGAPTAGEQRPWLKDAISVLSDLPSMGLAPNPLRRDTWSSAARVGGAALGTEGGPVGAGVNYLAESLAQVIDNTNDPAARVRAATLGAVPFGADVGLLNNAGRLAVGGVAAKKLGDLSVGKTDTSIGDMAKEGAMTGAVPIIISKAASPVVRVANILAGNGKMGNLGTAVRTESAKTARDSGYIIPESDSSVDKIIQWLGGKSAIGKQAQLLNSENNQRVAAMANGLDPEVARLTVQEMKAVRQQAYDQFYAPVANSGVAVVPDNVFKSQLGALMAPEQNATGAIPGLFKKEVEPKLMAMVQAPSMDIKGALANTQLLRENADIAFNAGNTTLATALNGASKALEDQIERTLTNSGQSGKDLLAMYRQGRKQMAIAYATEDALRMGGGAIMPARLGAAMQRGAPLTNGLDATGLLANNFRQYSGELGQVKTGSGISASIPAAVAGGAIGHFVGDHAVGGALAGGAVASGIRSMVVSKPYQKLMSANGQLDPAIANQISKFVTISAINARQAEINQKTSQVGKVLNAIAVKANPEAPTQQKAQESLPTPPPEPPPAPTIPVDSVKIKAPLSATTIKVSDSATVAKLDKLLAAQNPTESPAEQAATKAKEKKTYVLSNIRRDGNKIVGATVEVA